MYSNNFQFFFFILFIKYQQDQIGVQFNDLKLYLNNMHLTNNNNNNNRQDKTRTSINAKQFNIEIANQKKKNGRVHAIQLQSSREKKIIIKRTHDKMYRANLIQIESRSASPKTTAGILLLYHNKKNTKMQLIFFFGI